MYQVAPRYELNGRMNGAGQISHGVHQIATRSQLVRLEGAKAETDVKAVRAPFQRPAGIERGNRPQ